MPKKFTEQLKTLASFHLTPEERIQIALRCIFAEQERLIRKELSKKKKHSIHYQHK